MTVIVAGLEALRRTPLAVLPLTLEAITIALLVLLGALPASGELAPAVAIFPFDVYFDLKTALAHAPAWPWFVAAIAFALIARSGALAATLWLSQDSRPPLAASWWPILHLAALAALVLVVPAVLLLVGTAIRYAPLLWIGGIAGFLASAVLLRRALRLDLAGGFGPARAIPELSAYLGYALALGALAAILSVLSRLGIWAVAFFVAASGPLHALFLLGWRDQYLSARYTGRGGLVAAVSGALVVSLLVASVYDRHVRESAPLSTAGRSGTLVLLSGVDTTSTSGPLAALDPRDLGFERDQLMRLSYARGDYEIRHTHRDLDRVAAIVDEQLEATKRPRAWIGHSQASLVLDRLLARGLSVPNRAVDLAPPPMVPPAIRVPPPDVAEPGKPGADLARILTTIARPLGLPFDLDAPNSPHNLSTLVPSRSIPRLAVWALSDSVWLSNDWRRPGHANVVAFTDHVGVTNNARALTLARRFLGGRRVPTDEVSWRGLLVSVLRYAFEPWRPR